MVAGSKCASVAAIGDQAKRSSATSLRLATPAPVLLDEDAVITIRSLLGSADGDSHIGRALALPIGARLSKNNKLVKANPSHFVPVVPPGRTRANSVRALTRRSETRKDEDGNWIPETDPVQRQQFGEFKRFIVHFRGQWVDRDSPLVKQRPADYEAII